MRLSFVHMNDYSSFLDTMVARGAVLQRENDASVSAFSGTTN